MHAHAFFQMCRASAHKTRARTPNIVHRLYMVRTRRSNSETETGYDTAKWFTPELPQPAHYGDHDDTFRHAVRRIKASPKWVQRNGAFEGKRCDGAGDAVGDGGSGDESDSSLGSAPEGLCGAHIDVYWDQGAVGWYTAKVTSVQRRQHDRAAASDTEDEDDTATRMLRRRRRARRTKPTTLLCIEYDDGECDDAFSLREWLWSVSSQSEEWLAEKGKTRTRGQKKRARVLCSDSEDKESCEETEADEEDEGLCQDGDEPEEHSGGVLSYEDALRFCDYEHDRRCDPLYADAGGMAFHLCNDRWRHAFHHVPNRAFAEDLLRICSGPLLPGLTERRKRCKLCASGTCRRHGRGSGVSGPSGAFSSQGDNARCAMCNRRRTCVHVQLGALSERWIPMGSCCLRKLDAMILLHRALEGIRALRGHDEFTSDGVHCAGDDEGPSAQASRRLDVVRRPVDVFNRAIDTFDDAMGMDMRYERYGAQGAGFYRDI